MKTGEAQDYLVQATARVEKEDRHLLMVDVSERCIAARLAMYLRDAMRPTTMSMWSTTGTALTRNNYTI